ncbi:MAG: hypothetical protein JNK52_13005 [Zoogloeaceae bacterium]|nr:hypothetical protein [Zoogloeaceae bacterium]
MSLEAQARLKIDDKLVQAGWAIQDMKQLNLSAAMGVAVREYPTDGGPADYVLFVNRNAVGVIEAKKDGTGENLTVVENQTERYAAAKLKWRNDDAPLQSVVNPAVILSPLTQREAVLSSEIFESSAPHSNWLVHLLIEFVGPNLGCVWLAVLRFALQVPYEHFSSRAESLELLPHPAR